MSVGIVLLVHEATDRAEQVARHWARAGCPVVIHVDKNVPREIYDAFAMKLSDQPNVTFSQRHKCAWGTFGIVAATQSASQQLLMAYPEVRHVYLASGSCLPLRPIQELIDYLNDHPQTDFIESATTADVPWTVGGLEAERFTLRFPLDWKRHRFWFDKYVAWQRFCGVKRKMPDGLVPHMGSQWWCLTRQTLSAVLQDPERRIYDRFFRRVWIPDESYFQTLSRKYAINIESRSLTLSKFDHQGKPHIFYDDHLELLRRSNCFTARKIWRGADLLYRSFLSEDADASAKTEPDSGKIDRIFAKAALRRTRGRPGLNMQSRYPRAGIEKNMTAAPYSMLQGFTELFNDFEPWLARKTGAQVHGHLFAPVKAQFADAQDAVSGAMSDRAALRDYNPQAFLKNLIWNTRGEHQCFQFGPADNQAVNVHIAMDANAQISVISGAWAIPLFRSNANFADLRNIAARLQKTESDHLDMLRASWVKARVRIWTLADFCDHPMEGLQAVLSEIRTYKPPGPSEVPRMAGLEGFGKFLQNLKNQGMHPHLMGAFPVDQGACNQPPTIPRKPYLVR